mgnify:CR=1 FL=1
MGQFFQLVTTARSSNEYIYVFSVDDEGEVNIHWPRQEQLNENFKGMNESALVTTLGAEIYIPGKERGLRLSKKGTEHLVILFSKVNFLLWLCISNNNQSDCKLQFRNSCSNYWFEFFTRY